MKAGSISKASTVSKKDTRGYITQVHAVHKSETQTGSTRPNSTGAAHTVQDTHTLWVKQTFLSAAHLQNSFQLSFTFCPHASSLFDL